MRVPTCEIDTALRALQTAVSHGRTREYCLRLWSTFIRLRDQRRCVLCQHARGRLFAHHIVRKSFWDHVQYQTGNGITLCRRCHCEPHVGFNRRPDLARPMDAEGGEKIDLLTGLLHALLNDAQDRAAFREEHYQFDDQALHTFKKFQSIPPLTQFEGGSLEQAYVIWSQTPRRTLKAMLGSVGVRIPDDYVQTDQFTTFESETEGSVLFVRYIPPIPFRDLSDGGAEVES